MSKLHRDNAGYVGCSYEETQDPYFSYNKLSLPLIESDKTVIRDEVTFTVTVAGGKFVIDGTSQATVSLLEGNVYTFDQSDASNAAGGTHPLKFSYTADGTHGGGQEHTLGVTTNGTPGQSGAYTKIVVPFGQHDLKYYCGNHSGMGGAANVVKNTKAFTVGRPILKTTDAFGKTLGTGNNEDPYAANLVLAIPMNGSNNGTTFTDVSNVIRGTGSAKSITRTNAVTKTAESNFYGSSGYYDANSSRLAVASSSDFDFGSGEYTIEVWVYPTDTGTRNIVARSYTGGTGNYSGFILSTAGFLETTTQSSWNINISHTLPLNAWSHCAVVRSKDTWTYFVNGVSVGSATASGSVPTGPGDLYVSYRAGQTDFFGYMQDLRIYKGVAKYTTPFPVGGYGINATQWTGTGSDRNVGGTIYSNLIGASASGQTTSLSTQYTTRNLFDGDGNTYLATAAANISSNPNILTVTFPEGSRPSYSQNVVLDVWSSTSDTVRVAINGGAWQAVSASTSAWQQHTVATGSGTISEIKVSRQKSNTNAGAAEIRKIIVDGNELLDGLGHEFLFKPDLVWVKSKSNTWWHEFYDSARGAGIPIYPNQNNSEPGNNRGVIAFTDTGFTVSDANSYVGTNNSGNTYVGFAFKAGGAPTTNNTAGAGNVPTAGSVKIDGANKTTALAGTLPVTRLTASTTYGFSCLTYTGNSTPNATIAHGLDDCPSPPSLIMIKNRDATYGWSVLHTSIDQTGTTLDGSPEYEMLQLDENYAGSNFTNDNIWNVTSSTFKIHGEGTANWINESNDHVAYCWSEIPGFSKFSKFEGAPTVTVTTGFKPKLIIIKNIDQAGSWAFFDAARDGDGEINNRMYLNEDSTNSDNIVIGNFTDTGFVLTNEGNTNWNKTGDTFVYAAWAEFPTGEGFESAIVDQLDLKDRSGNSNNASNVGATWQTSVKKFYGGASYFNRSDNDNLIIPASSDFNFGGGDFTLECWFNQLSNNSMALTDYVGQSSASAPSGQWYYSSSNGLQWYHSGSNYAAVSQSWSLGQWVHAALVRSGNTLTTYINGSPQGSSAFTRTDAGSSTNDFRIGLQGSTAWDGYIQDFRIYKGIAKYTSSFSPPERSVQGTARRYPSGVFVVS